MTRRAASILMAPALLLAVPAMAADPKPAATPAAAPAATPAPAASPTSGKTANGTQIQTPVDDLNLRKQELSPVLQAAVDRPYSLEGLGQCSQLVAAVEELNTALGKDIDLPQDGGNRLAAGDLMNFAASSVIPFRGLIREVTGAGSRQRQVQEAVLAGFARRSFLKGVGAARNCAYPARPADAQVVAAQAAAVMASLEAMCGPLPNGQKRSAREEWLNSRKCADYKRARAEAAAAAPAAASSTPAAAPAPPAATGRARRN